MICKKVKAKIKIKEKAFAKYNEKVKAFKLGLCPKCGSEKVQHSFLWEYYKCKKCKYMLVER